MRCAHVKVEVKTVQREFLNQKFKSKGAVCTECGAELWDEELNGQFKFWVDGLDVKQKVQFKISKIADRCLEEALKLQFPSATPSSLVRAMIGIYLNLLDRPKVREIINRTFESTYYRNFESEVATKLMGVEVKPLLFLDLQTWSNLLDQKPNELASEAFHIMLCLCIDKDEKLREFWNREILPELRTILKVS